MNTSIRARYLRKFFGGLLCITLGSLLHFLSAEAQNKASSSFKISDDEMDQIMEGMKSLTPEQIAELEDIWNQTQKKMKEKGFDPEKEDDVLKFLESEGLLQQGSEIGSPSKQQQPKAIEPKLSDPISAPTKLADVSAPLLKRVDTGAMINQLIDHIASLRQKAITRPSLLVKIKPFEHDLAELIVYLNVVRTPDLVKLLKEKDFMRLTSSLESLHEALIRFEPSISARKRSPVINEEDPYEVLDLPYTATSEAIEQQFKKLSATMSPQAIEAHLQKEGTSGSIAKKVKKSAARAYSLVESSYKALINAESRQKVDARLYSIIEAESRSERQSIQAFDRLKQALMSALSGDRILLQIHQLIEKYKPEEAKLLKAQIEKEKQVFERSKKRIEIPQINGAAYQMREMNDSLYRNQPRYNRYPNYGSGHRGQGQGRPANRRSFQGSSESPREGKPSKGKPEAGKPVEGASQAGLTEEPRKTQSKATEKSSPGNLGENDFQRIAALQQLEDLLDEASDKEATIKVKRSIRGDQEVDFSIDDILKDVDSHITGTASIPDAGDDLKRYFDEQGFSKLEKALKSLAAGKKKLPEGPLAKKWKEKIAPKLAPYVKSTKEVLKYLDSTGRTTAGLSRVNDRLWEAHGLHIPDKDAWYKKKKDENEEKHPEITATHLGKIRTTAKNINAYLQILQGS